MNNEVLDQGGAVGAIFSSKNVGLTRWLDECPVDLGKQIKIDVLAMISQNRN